MRGPHLAQPDPLRRPAELLLGAHQRLRLLRRGRADDGHRDHAAHAHAAHAAQRVLAHRRPRHLRRRRPDGAGRDDRVPVPDDAARLHLRAPGRRHRRARHLLLRPHRRPGARPARGLAQAAGGDPRRVRDLHRPHPRPGRPQPHLHRPHAPRRRADARAGHQLRRHRADAALHRAGARHPQGHAVPRLRRPRLRGAHRHPGRQLRPLCRAHARDGRVGAHDPAVRATCCPPARSTSTTRASASPTRGSSTTRSSRSSTTSSW